MRNAIRQIKGKRKLENLPGKTIDGSIIITTAILWTTSNFRLELIRFLVLKGYQVYCIGDPYDKFAESEGRLKSVGAEVIKIAIDRKSVNVFHDVQYFFKLLKVYRKIKPIVALHFTPKPNIYGSLVCRILGLRSISTINGLGSGILQRNIASVIQLSLYRLSLRHQKIVFFQNTSDSQYFMQKRMVKPYQVRSMPGSGIITEYFNLPSVNIERPLKFMFVGRLLKDKGFNEFIEAARKIVLNRANVKFYVAGFLDAGNPSAVTSSYLDDLVKEGVIEYLGPFPDVREAFKKAHIVVLPSYREGLSRLLLEAASCNRPLIATDVPGCREIVTEGVNGLLCEPRSPISLCNAMIKMVDMTDCQIRAMGEAGREMVIKYYNSDIVNKAYLEAIEEIVERR